MTSPEEFSAPDPIDIEWAGMLVDDLERQVRAEHRRECADNEWCGECVCGWLVPEDAEDFTAAHEAHVGEMVATARREEKP